MGNFSKFIHVAIGFGPQILAGGFSFLPVSLFIKEAPTWYLASLLGSYLRGRESEAQTWQLIFYNLISDVMHDHPIISYWLHRSALLQCGGGEYLEVGDHWGHLGHAYHERHLTLRVLD